MLERYTSVGTHRGPAQEPPTFRGTTWKTSRSVQLESRRSPVRVPGGVRHEAGFNVGPVGRRRPSYSPNSSGSKTPHGWHRRGGDGSHGERRNPSLATIKSIAWRPHASADADLSRAGGGGRKSPRAGRDCSSDTLSRMRDIDTRRVRGTSTADVAGRYEAGRRVKEWWRSGEGLGESPQVKACRPGPSPERYHEGEAAHIISSAESRLVASSRLMPRRRQ